jgi:hypothetical protein
MDPTKPKPQPWPSEAQMPPGPGMPEESLQLWDADGWSCASMVIARELSGTIAPQRLSKIQ